VCVRVWEGERERSRLVRWRDGKRRTKVESVIYINEVS